MHVVIHECLINKSVSFTRYLREIYGRTVGRQIICTTPKVLFLLFYITKNYLEASVSGILSYIIPSTSTVIFGFKYLSISV